MAGRDGADGSDASISRAVSADPFGTAALRAAVLDAWAASPHRFREDANAEEWLSLGYAGRVIAELAANGADAAAAAGVPGRIAFRLDGRTLCVANNGAPLTATGVAALASLRASAKRPEPAADADSAEGSDDRTEGSAGETSVAREGSARAGSPDDRAAGDGAAGGRAASRQTSASVGHFGVGFTAVRAISDEITVVSTTGSIRFSVQETAAALQTIGDTALRAEVERRSGQLPALRLPWPAPGLAPPDGYATEVRLLLRNGVDIASVATVLGLGGDAVSNASAVDPLAGPAGTAHVAEASPTSRTGDLARILGSEPPDDDSGDIADRTAEPALELATDLLWALPGLAKVALPTITVQRRERPDEPGIEELVASGVVQRFRVHRAAGELPADVLADRPVEERGRTGWFVTWIVPLDEEGVVRPVAPTVVGAPTPTAEKIGVPARLVASLPVDEVRSRIAPGPLTDFVVARAVVAYGELIRTLPAEQRFALIPAPGFPLGEWDALFRERLTADLARADLLPGAGGQPIRPADAVVIPGIHGPAAAAVAEALPGLLAWPGAAAQVEALRGLGVRVGTLGEALNAVAMVERSAAFYLPLYDALADAPPDDLAGLPIPRNGGGTLIGARGVLLAPADPVLAGPPGTDGSSHDAVDDEAREHDVPGADALASGELVGDTSWAAQAARLVPGLRIAAPGLNHPLLRRLGARELDAETLLTAPELAREIRRRYEDFDAGELADDWDGDGSAEHDFPALVLGLLAAAGSAPPGVEADLARLLLTDDDGQVYPAGELLMPGAPLRAVLADDADLPTVGGTDWVDRYGAEVLEMLGVRTTFGVVRYPLPPGDDADLDAVDLWWEEAATEERGSGGGGAVLDETQEFTAITDLDLVADDAWPQALALIAASQPAREALRRTAFGPSYSAWWLRHYAALEGLPPNHWRTVDAVELAGLYDAAPGSLVGGLPADLQAEIGVLRTLLDAAADPAELLVRWADANRALPAARVPAVTAAVIDAVAGAAEDEIPLPATVRTLGGAVIDAEGAVVLDHPMLAQVLDPGVLVAGGGDPARAAELLDLPLASEENRWTVIDGDATARTLVDLPGARRCLDWLGRPDLAGRPVTISPELAVRVSGRAGPETTSPRRVTWWIADGRALHLDGSAHGIARAVADLAGRWADRYLLQAVADGTAADLAELGIDSGRG